MEFDGMYVNGRVAVGPANGARKTTRRIVATKVPENLHLRLDDLGIMIEVSRCPSSATSDDFCRAHADVCSRPADGVAAVHLWDSVGLRWHGRYSEERRQACGSRSVRPLDSTVHFVQSLHVRDVREDRDAGAVNVQAWQTLTNRSSMCTNSTDTKYVQHAS